jgi:hypothetical protein
MSEAKHTPGPWQMSGSRGPSPEYRGHGVGPDGGNYVVVVPYNDRDHVECIANARLIAAAPDLLDVAKRCLAMADEGDGPPYWDWIRSIIAKAEGRQP